MHFLAIAAVVSWKKMEGILQFAIWCTVYLRVQDISIKHKHSFGGYTKWIKMASSAGSPWLTHHPNVQPPGSWMTRPAPSSASSFRGSGVSKTAWNLPSSKPPCAVHFAWMCNDSSEQMTKQSATIFYKPSYTLISLICIMYHYIPRTRCYTDCLPAYVSLRAKSPAFPGFGFFVCFCCQLKLCCLLPTHFPRTPFIPLTCCTYQNHPKSTFERPRWVARTSRNALPRLYTCSQLWSSKVLQLPKYSVFSRPVWSSLLAAQPSKGRNHHQERKVNIPHSGQAYLLCLISFPARTCRHWQMLAKACNETSRARNPSSDLFLFRTFAPHAAEVAQRFLHGICRPVLPRLSPPQRCCTMESLEHSIEACGTLQESSRTFNPGDGEQRRRTYCPDDWHRFHIGDFVEFCFTKPNPPIGKPFCSHLTRDMWLPSRGRKSSTVMQIPAVVGLWGKDIRLQSIEKKPDLDLLHLAKDRLAAHPEG